MPHIAADYAFFLNLFCCVSLVVIYAVVSAILWYRGDLSASELSFPTRRFAVMGLLDCLGYLLMAFGQVYTAGNMQSLLGCTR